MIKERQPAVADLAEARELLAAVEAMPAHLTTKLANRLLAITVVRPGELRGSRWGKFEGLEPGDARPQFAVLLRHLPRPAQSLYN